MARRFDGQPAHRQGIGRAGMVGRDQDRMAGCQRRPQPVDVSDFMGDDAFFPSQQKIVKANAAEKGRPKRPDKRRQETVGLLNDDFLHGDTIVSPIRRRVGPSLCRESPWVQLVPAPGGFDD
jgi:hypothetical protein